MQLVARTASLLIFVMQGLIRAYQRAVSPLLGNVCRFDPSCSEYLFQALSRRGLLKGLWLGFRRVLRCHPFHPGGYDPVP